MSHTVSIQVQVRDAAAVHHACQRLNLPAPILGTVKLFDSEVTGLAIQLPTWTYPVVADLTSGELRYDNFQGRWGDQKHLDQFLQAYAICRATTEARRRGHSVTEQKLADGAIKLTINVAGGVA